LEDKVSTTLNQIAKAGQLSDKKFLIESRNFHKIRNIKKSDVEKVLGVILTQNIMHSGIKGKVDPATKQDILNMIQTKFKSLSIPEINKAFEIDRYSSKPEEHFNLFNAKYVAQILHKYIEWRRTNTHEKKLNIEPKKDKVFTPDEIRENRKALIKNIYNEIKSNGFCHEAWLIYDDVNAPKKNDLEYKKLLYQKELKANEVKRKLENPFQKFKSSQEGYVKNRSKAIIVCDYLKDFAHDYELFKTKITSI
jgi:hypothetical protein